jgi:hypothetical protein
MSLLLCLAFLAPLASGVTREFTKTYPLRPDGSFTLSNVNGTVRIEGWDREEVKVRAVKTTPDKESFLDLVAIDIDARPDALTISTRYPQEGGVEVAVDYVIHVPRHAHLNLVNNINGTLRVINSGSVGELHTVNGNIEVYEGSGNIHARTTNGNVYVELRHLADARGVAPRSSVCTPPGSSLARSSNTNINARMRSADSRGVSAETTNGSVLLAIPADSSADLEARCMNGSFSSDLPMVMKGAEQPRTVHGRLGRGGAPIHLGTVNGTIRVVALPTAI